MKIFTFEKRCDWLGRGKIHCCSGYYFYFYFFAIHSKNIIMLCFQWVGHCII